MPQAEESAALFVLLGKQLAQIAEHANLSDEIVEKESAKGIPTGIKAPQWAAWTGVCRVLLNLDEVISKQ